VWYETAFPPGHPPPSESLVAAAAERACADELFAEVHVHELGDFEEANGGAAVAAADVGWEGFSAKEVPESLGTTVASVNSALQRARRAVEEQLSATSQQATLSELGDRRIDELVQRFVGALSRGRSTRSSPCWRRTRRLCSAPQPEIHLRPMSSGVGSRL
jgi:hypothetical protein